METGRADRLTTRRACLGGIYLGFSAIQRTYRHFSVRINVCSGYCTVSLVTFISLVFFFHAFRRDIEVVAPLRACELNAFMLA